MSGEQTLDDLARRFDQRTAPLVILVHGDGDLRPTRANALEVDSHLAGVGIQRLFLLAAFLEQMVPFGRSEFGIVTGRFQSKVGENLVEVVAAKIRDAVRCFDRLFVFSQSHERNIESAATHVVDEQAAANAIAALGAIALRKFDRRSRRLVHQSQHRETSSSAPLPR